MGFFKKIGSLVKKNVSFKNLVKVAGTGLSFVPGVGAIAGGLVQNLQANHEAKKQEQAQVQAQAEAQAQYDAQMMQQKSNPNIAEILTGAAGGALTGVGTVLAGSQTAGNTGATLIENTTNTWLKRNWLKLVGGVLGAVTVIMVFVRVMKPHNGTRRTSYRR